MSDSRFAALTIVIGIVFAAAVYLPDVGRGFVKDDFRWLQDARTVLADPAEAVVPRLPNFYRPVVVATFVAEYPLLGLNARGYGLTNFALYVACASAIWLLLRRTGVGMVGASVGTLAWSLNPHGINMAVVWISGRTSLLATFFTVTSTLAFLGRRRVAGSLLLFAALLSKEEAIAMPLVIVAWLLILEPKDLRDAVLDMVAVAVPLALYFTLRLQTPALTPATAPWFYRPAFDWRIVGHNALEYLDRGASFAVALALVAMLAHNRWRIGARSQPLLVAGIVWFCGGYVLTVWLPVRSSLYAVLPSVGSALVCAALVDGIRRSDEGNMRSTAWLAACLAGLLAFIPIYRHRNARWVEPARISERFVRAISVDPPAASSGVVVLEDDAGPASFDTALGTHATTALQLVTGLPFEAHLVRPANDWTGSSVAKYKLYGGHVERVE